MLVYGRVYKVLTSLEGKEEMYHTPNANNLFADEIKPHKKMMISGIMIRMSVISQGLKL